MAPWQFFLLGAPRLEQDRQTVNLSRRKAIAVLAYLAVTRQPHSRDELATLLWPDQDQSGARANLRRDLSTLKQIVGDQILLIDQALVSLTPEAGVWTDVGAFEASVMRVQQHSHTNGQRCAECAAALKTAVDLYTGDFMTGFSLPDSPQFDEWQFFETERLRHLFAIALQRLIGWHTDRAEYETALAYARRWLALDTLHESAQRQLMQLYAWTGQQAAALRQYQECARLLHAELGAPPSAETTALYEAIRTKQFPRPTPEHTEVSAVAEIDPGELYRTGRPLTRSTPARMWTPSSRATAPASGQHDQQIHFCTAPDGVRIAYGQLGSGPLLIKAGNPLNHLEYDRHSPIWQHWWTGLAERYQFVRYDERGYGLSDWNVADFSMDAWVGDLETVADQFNRQRFALLGVSQGASVAIAYAVRHPERVSHLILYGGYARGRFNRTRTPEQLEEARTMIHLIRVGWGRDNAAFRQVFAKLLMPDGTPEQIDWFTELARVSASAENAALIEMACYNVNVAPLAPHVHVPTLVLHARHDAMCPFEEGRLLASLIPGARFVPLESNNHILMENEPAWPQFLSEITQFTQTELEPSVAVSPAVAVTASPTKPAPQPELEQTIRFCQSADGVRLAYATIGSGPPLVKAANWLSHLEFDWQSPIWRHWLIGLAKQHTLIRYDERGCGLSDWNVDEFSLEAWVRDLEAVVEAAGVERFPLLGLSQGGPIAMAYAVRHPERVSHLILYGSYARGKRQRDLTSEKIDEVEMLVKLIRLGWGRENPAFRQVFTSMFIPDGTLEQYHWFNDLMRASASPENAARLVEGFNLIEVRHLAAQINIPTLVLHARHDMRIPFEEGRLLASLIPGARLVTLESNNHILLEHEPAWQKFLSEVHAFLAAPGQATTTTP